MKCLYIIFFGVGILILKEGNSASSPNPNFTPSKEEQLRNKVLNGYVKEIRPSSTTNIRVLLHLITINDLETKTQTFSTSGYFVMKWKDDRLVWNTSDYNDVDAIWSDIKTLWWPPVMISNEVKNVKVINDLYNPIKASYDGSVTWSPALLMETECDLDVTYYPFDTQSCMIEMVVWGYSMNEVNLRASSIDMSDYNENGEWQITNFYLERTERSRDGTKISRLDFVFDLIRRPSYYILNAIVPSVLMSFLSPIVFLLPASSGEKVSYIITVFLAYAVLLTLIVEHLPSSSLMPSAISIYLTVITVLGAVAVIVTIKNLDIYHRDPAIPIPIWMHKLTDILEIVLCERKPKMNSTVKPTKPQEGNREISTNKNTKISDAEKEPYKPPQKQRTWMDIANLLDIFWYRVLMLLTLTGAAIFLGFLVVHYLESNAGVY